LHNRIGITQEREMLPPANTLCTHPLPDEERVCEIAARGAEIALSAFAHFPEKRSTPTQRRSSLLRNSMKWMRRERDWQERGGQQGEISDGVFGFCFNNNYNILIFSYYKSCKNKEDHFQ
jgi:hypothetical protein